MSHIPPPFTGLNFAPSIDGAAWSPDVKIRSVILLPESLNRKDPAGGHPQMVFDAQFFLVRHQGVSS
ncbi:MAG: hypothetical protein WAM61_20070 [Desulfobacterales bacterium]